MMDRPGAIGLYSGMVSAAFQAFAAMANLTLAKAFNVTFCPTIHEWDRSLSVLQSLKSSLGEMVAPRLLQTLRDAA